MHWLTEDATVICDHQLGVVTKYDLHQHRVTIGGRKVLVASDPAGCPIARCPVVPPMGKPCTRTLPVVRGYSDLVTIEGHRVCLDTVTGLTNGVTPVPYRVRTPGQTLVDSTS
jgi:hypothetical protein